MSFLFRVQIVAVKVSDHQRQLVKEREVARFVLRRAAAFSDEKVDMFNALRDFLFPMKIAEKVKALPPRHRPQKGRQSALQVRSHKLGITDFHRGGSLSQLMFTPFFQQVRNYEFMNRFIQNKMEHFQLELSNFK